jgi:hypothetical protein
MQQLIGKRVHFQIRKPDLTNHHARSCDAQCQERVGRGQREARSAHAQHEPSDQKHGRTRGQNRATDAREREDGAGEQSAARTAREAANQSTREISLGGGATPRLGQQVRLVTRVKGGPVLTCQNRVQQLEMSLTKETTRATQAEASVTDLTNKLRTVAEALKSEREQFKKEVSTLTARVTEKESSASEWDRKIKLANVKIEEQESRLNAEQNKSQELQRRVTQLERELVQKNTETPRGDRAALNELEERLREAEDRAANAEALVSELEGELARYENQEQSYETEPQQYETPVSGKSKRIRLLCPSLADTCQVPDITPPPPMVGGGPPPPPPPPPPMAKASSGALKINRKPKTGGGAPKAAPAKVAPPGPQSNIVDQLKRGVSLRKTEGVSLMADEPTVFLIALYLATIDRRKGEGTRRRAQETRRQR